MSTDTYSTRLYHCVKYADAPAAIDWLQRVLGFEQIARFDTDDGLVAHCQLAWPGGGGVMCGSVAAGTAEFAAGSGLAYLVVDDADALYSDVLAAGVAPDQEIHSPDQGGRAFSVRDPEGNQWSVGSYPGEPRP